MKQHGGNRQGSGRKNYFKEKTVAFLRYLPKSKLKELRMIIKSWEYCLCKEPEPNNNICRKCKRKLD